MNLYDIDLLFISLLLLLDPTFKKQGNKIPILFHVSFYDNLTKLTPSKCANYDDGIDKKHVCFSRSLYGVTRGGTQQFSSPTYLRGEWVHTAYLYVLDNRKITALLLKGHIFKAHDLVYHLGRLSHLVDIDIEVPVVKIATLIKNVIYPIGVDPQYQIFIYGWVKDKAGKKVPIPDKDKARVPNSGIPIGYNNLKDFYKEAKKVNNNIPNITLDQLKAAKSDYIETDSIQICYERKKYNRQIYRVEDVNYDIVLKLYGKLHLMKFKIWVETMKKKFKSLKETLEKRSVLGH